MRSCEACGATGVALFAGAASGPPLVRCGPCIEPLRPHVARVWLVASGPSERRWRVVGEVGGVVLLGRVGEVEVR